MTRKQAEDLVLLIRDGRCGNCCREWDLDFEEAVDLLLKSVNENT